MRVLRAALNLVSSAWGCGHDRMSRPFTIERQTYMVCLHCGRKVFYSPDRMRPVSRREAKRAANAKTNEPPIAA